jgi:retron-type reverse transcriptase
MKRYGALYAQIYDFANLANAYHKARRCKRYKNAVLKYSADLEENLINLQNHLIWKDYTQGQKRIFLVYEPKTRTISALPFRDRVMHHAVNNIIEPIFDRRFYYHSYACRAGKGMHRASKTLTKWIRNLSFDDKPLYALKADIHHYFQSIDHTKLKAIIRRTIKDPDALWLLDCIIDDGGENGRGIPVGNLTSQLFANIYLDVLDKHIKETLRIKHYIRYMDDFIILSNDKTELRAVLRDLERFLHVELNLLFNPKTTVLSAKNGIDFCGFRHYENFKKVRKRSVKTMERMIKAYHKGKTENERFSRSLASWLGHIGHADTFRLRMRILQKIEAVPP